MTGFDKARVEHLISIMRESVRLLVELRALRKEEFLANEHLQGSAKYNFVIAIEAAIDTANHVISTRGFRAPKDYADAFAVLSENGVLEDAFAEELKMMARFRNRMVHRYWDVSVDQLWNLLQTRLGDFEKYVNSVMKYLNSLDSSP